MNQIKSKVIDNIHNITSDYYIIIEPFKNVNNSFVNYIHHRNSDYFDYNYQNLTNHNFSIEKIYNDFPQRLGLSASFVLLKKK